MPNSPTLYRILPHDIASDAAAAALRHAADVLRLGGLVAFPTETVYGLGANALDPAAVAKIFAAKGRPANNPLIVHVARLEQARQVAAAWPEAADRLAARFWPGPLTIVVPRAPQVPDIVTAGAATIAIRIPVHPVARALLDAVDLPIAAPSANRSNQVSPTTAAHVLRGLGQEIDVVIDGGPATGGLESTVIDLSTDRPRLLRPGLIRPSAMESILGPIDRPDMSFFDPNVASPSPGTQPRHYAPRAAMECVAENGRQRIETLCSKGLRVGWLEFGDNLIAVPRSVVVVMMPGEASAYAAELYAALHEMDAAGVDRIVVDLPPDGEAWQAIHDRLRRGCTEEA